MRTHAIHSLVSTIGTVALATAVLAPTGGRAQAQTPSGGTIVGLVTDEVGKPVSSARVSYFKTTRRIPISPSNPFRSRPDPSDPHIAGDTLTGSDGQFTINSLQPGEYTVCVEAPGAGLLENCKWGPPVFPVLTEAGGTKVLRIGLRRAALMQVRINDQQGLMPADDTFAAPKLVAGVMTDEGSFYRAHTASRSTAGRDLELLVPLDTPLKLWLFSRDLQLTREDGTGIDASNTAIPFQVSAGTASVRYTFNIVGQAR